MPAAPQRRCVGCGLSVPKGELLRLVAVGGELVADPAARRPGRGAYVHRDPVCYGAAVRRRALSRALRARVNVPDEPPYAF